MPLVALPAPALAPPSPALVAGSSLCGSVLGTGGGRNGSPKQAPGPVQHGHVLLALFKHLRGAHSQAAQPEEEAGSCQEDPASSSGSSLRDTHALTSLTRTNPHLLSVTAESGGSNALFDLVPEYRDMDLRNCF